MRGGPRGKAARARQTARPCAAEGALTRRSPARIGGRQAGGAGLGGARVVMRYPKLVNCTERVSRRQQSRHGLAARRRAERSSACLAIGKPRRPAWSLFLGYGQRDLGRASGALQGEREERRHALTNVATAAHAQARRPNGCREAQQSIRHRAHGIVDRGVQVAREVRLDPHERRGIVTGAHGRGKGSGLSDARRGAPARLAREPVQHARVGAVARWR